MEESALMDYYYKLIDKERNIYELAGLVAQNRRPVREYAAIIQNPVTKEKMSIEELESISYDNIADFMKDMDKGTEWEKMNRQFLNYHKSLTVYELINSLPIVNYMAFHSGIGFVKNMKVADIGGGTGQAYCSSFLFPETLDYFLVDPNLRLLHDQFYRIYPKFSFLKMGHILAKAENLPFIEDAFDLTMSRASIDHMEDYKKFIKEAKRITKPGGIIFITSHLDIPPSDEDSTKTSSKILSLSFLERLTRFLYFKKYGVKSDDHTFHFESIDSIIDEMEKNGLKIEKQHIFKRHFYIVARK